MKHKGFTLIELIGVIILIGIIALIVYPVILNIISNNKEKAYQRQIENLREISYRWSLDNEKVLNQTPKYKLRFQQLISSGFVKSSEILDPRTGDMLIGCMLVSWQPAYNQYTFTYAENCGELGDIAITLPYETFDIEAGTSYNIPVGRATTDTGEVVDVKAAIKKNNIIVNEIDTKDVGGVYTLYYSFVDKKGNLGINTIEVTIVDTAKPTIEFELVGNQVNEKGWSKTSININVKVNDPSAKNYKWCSTINTSCDPIVTSLLPNGISSIGAEGTTSKICAVGYDKVGNTSDVVCSSSYKIDKTKPTISGLSDVVIKKGVTVNLTSGVTTSDSLSGTDGAYSYNPTMVNTSSIGNQIVTYTATDNAGNIASETRNIKVTSGEPGATFTTTGSFNTSGWAKENFNVIVTGVDYSTSGIKEIKYCQTTSSSCTPTTTVTASTATVPISIESASSKACVTVTDNTDTEGPRICTETYKLDKTNPTFVGIENTTVPVGGTIDLAAGVSVSDTLSGINGTYSYNPTTINTTSAGTTTVTYTATDNAGNVKTSTRTVEVMLPQADFAYTGAVQTYTIPVTGVYKLEVWGAQGGDIGSCVGGLGGYSIGNIYLENKTELYVYVGGKGSSGINITQGGFNGGGASSAGGNASGASSGGGAADIRIGADSLYARVIVAGGGAGLVNNGCTPIGYGGGTTGGAGSATNGGSQTAGGTGSGSVAASFGIGSYTTTNTWGRGGGGGGWYGGGVSSNQGGGGGSGWIYTSSTYTTWANAVGATENAKWLLNSNYYLTAATTYGGNTSFTSPSGTAETGHTGPGFARITYIGQ